jgi:dTDP-4-dehydrorhamnose 3,5-epimerase
MGVIITEAALPGVYLVDIAPIPDERGFFARSFSAEEFAAKGMHAEFGQSSISFNARAGTLRGMHYQVSPHEEHKLVRCTSGTIFDVVVDIRRQSADYCRWFGTELSAENRRALFVPPGFAHGFITLSDQTEVLYMIGGDYSPAHGRGVRWNDPALGIDWPLMPSVIAARDDAYPLLGS